MCFERCGAGCRVDDLRSSGQLVACDNDVLVAGAAAFGSDDGCVVCFGDFVDDADEAFVPAFFVVVVRLGLLTVSGVGEAGL